MRIIEPESRVTMYKRRNFVNYATMTLADGTVLNLKPSDFRLSGNSFTDDGVSSDAFEVGTTIGKTATITLDNTDNRREIIDGEVVIYPHGKFSEYDFYKAYFYLYVCLPKAFEDDGEYVDEMIPIGKFTVTEPVANSSTIEITGVDDMYLFDRSFDDCNLDFTQGVSLLTVLNKCCEDCGVAIGYTTFSNANLIVYNKPESVTYREVVGYIAQIAGENVKISKTSALVFYWYHMDEAFGNWLDGGTFLHPGEEHYEDGDDADGGTFNPWNIGYSVDEGNFADPPTYHNIVASKSTVINTDNIKFTGVRVLYDEVDTHYPDTEYWDDYYLEISENPFVVGNELSIATTVFNGSLEHLNFRPFSCSTLQDPTIEVGDCAMIYDTKGNYFPTIITNVSFVTGGYTGIKSTAASPTRQVSRYTNSAVTKAKQVMTDYSSKVAHFNELANNALGYYKTEVEDSQTHSITTYIHDGATLESSTIIWKITSTGIFISENGGQSYTSGYDASTGTMLMNLIYAHGITCDWIKSGTLTLGGFDNIDGLCTVLDAYGNEQVRLSNQGINATAGYIAGMQIHDNRIETVDDLNSVRVALGCLAASRKTSSSSWGGIYYGHPDYAFPNSFILYDASSGDNGIHVAHAAPNQGLDGVSFTAMKYNTFQFWRDYNIQAWVDESGFHTASDKNLKQDIISLVSTKIKSFFNKVNPVQFVYRHDLEHTHYGIIAQEVREALKSSDLQYDSIVNDDGDSKYLNVNYAEFHGLELAGIKDLYNIVNQQQLEINLLHEKLNSLKKVVNNLDK